MTLQSWLQERQYATPYHWHQRHNDEVEYGLRTNIVVELAAINGTISRRHRPRLLDVGCGDGRFTADAARHAETVGVDLSRRAIGFAHTLAPQVSFLASAAEALPFAPASFDVVTLLDVIEHIPDDQEHRVVGEAVRVLRPGGRLVISTNTDRSACELKHYRHYPLARFRALFDGLTDVDLTGLIPYFPTLRFWMAAPLVWRWTCSRVRRCAPEVAQVVVGAGTKASR